MTLGQRLKIARIQSNLKQNKAAEMINISGNVLSTYERDIRDPDTQTLKKLCELYSISSDFLLDIKSEDVESSFKIANPLTDPFNEVLTELTFEELKYLSSHISDDDKNLLKTMVKNAVISVDEYLSSIKEN
ncbi:helix-turn-helix domain-containing protein [Alkalihalobacillus sp. NPDC078783]